VHGLAAERVDHVGERGPIDTEGDIADATTERELRKR
jgi:hypothetical protein